MGKKNLEQLFKDTFSNFQEIPDEKVWRSIEASLDKKKQKNRIIPIWWQLGGVAAALAVILYMVDPFGADDIENGVDQIISDTENTITPDQNHETVNEKDFNDPSTITEAANVADTAKKSESSNSSHTQDDPDAAQKGFSTTSKRQVAEVDQKTDRNGDGINTKVQGQGEKEALAVADAPNIKATHQDKLSTEKQLQEDRSKEKDAIAQHNAQDPSLEKESVTDIQSKKEDDGIAMNEEEKEEHGISIFDAIKEQEAEEEVAAQENSSGKWSVGPSVAPVYFGASGDGSPIHSDFTSNSKSGNFNLSYGLTVAYEVGKKVKIRSGIHKVNYGYDTNDVIFSSSLRSASNEALPNIDYSQNSENIVVQSKNKTFSGSPDLASKEVALNEMPILDGKMVQQLGYIEVPLEVNYAVLDKKFGVDLIGGVSSLFLVDNAVLLESQDKVTEVGEANNANSVNFSANLGMGLNYKFSPKVQFNLEPVFKYQLNTFSNTAGVFQPFSIGVYSGVSFKF